MPTFAEAGFKGYSADAWYGLLAPAGTPVAALHALEKVSLQFAEQANSVTKLQGLGMEPQHLCRDAFGGMLESDTKAYVKLANDLNLKLD